MTFLMVVVSATNNYVYIPLHTIIHESLFNLYISAQITHFCTLVKGGNTFNLTGPLIFDTMDDNLLSDNYLTVLAFSEKLLRL